MAGDALPGSVARAWLNHRLPSRSAIDCPAQESAAQLHGRYEVGEDDAGVSPKGVGAAVALCLRARPLSGVGSVTTP